jgi:neutral amino acid transport system permease protein
LRTLARAVLTAMLLLGALATPALAQEDENGDGEAVRGTLRDAGEPIEGGVVTVFGSDGEEVGTGTSDAEGAWEVPLPAPGAYTASVDEETLPEGVGLRDPERDVLEFTIRPGQQRTLIFQLGEREGAAARWVPRIAQSAANGVKFGLIIAMTAIGLSLIFGTTGLVNFAHGELVTFGAILAFFLNAAGPRMPLIFAGVIAVAAGGLLGGGLERGLWRPLRRRKTGLIQMLVISIGLALVLRHILLIFFGGRSRPYLDYAVQRGVNIGPILLTPRDMIVMALSLIMLIGVGLLLQKTKIGKGMRAVSDNKDLAESSGIDVQKIILFVWVLGAALAAMGGVFLGVVENVSYIMGFRLLLLIFAGVILGGLGTAYGAMVGSLVVGLVTELSTLYFSTELKFVWALLVLSIVLLFRPQGILGVRERIG